MHAHTRRQERKNERREKVASLANTCHEHQMTGGGGGGGQKIRKKPNQKKKKINKKLTKLKKAK
jgi:hypothetical protein